MSKELRYLAGHSQFPVGLGDKNARRTGISKKDQIDKWLVGGIVLTVDMLF